jgi:hypothetical protein
MMLVCGGGVRRTITSLPCNSWDHSYKLLISIEGLRDFIFVVPYIDPDISGWN